MSGLVNRKIEMLETTLDGVPLYFRDKKAIYRVIDVLDRWRGSGAWWENEPEKAVFRVLTEDNSIMELDHAEDEWQIYLIFD